MMDFNYDKNGERMDTEWEEIIQEIKENNKKLELIIKKNNELMDRKELLDELFMKDNN